MRKRSESHVTRRNFLEKAGGLAGAILFPNWAPIARSSEAHDNSSQEMAVVMGRVLDSETGKVIPCTVAIRSSDGANLIESPSFTGGIRSNGEFQKRVPAGETSVTVSRGFDYIAQEKKLALRKGERLELAFSLGRRAGLRRRGWYSSDNHVHMIHGERRIAVDFPYVARAAEAAGLDFMSLAQHWAIHPATAERLEQVCRKLSSEDFVLAWNMEAPKNYWRGEVSHCLGHGWTLAMQGYTPEGKDAISELVAMSALDYESEKAPTPNFEIQAFIHSLGGIVSYTHPTREWRGKWGGTGIYPVKVNKFISNLSQELPFDTVIGPTYDTLDILMRTEEKQVNRKAQELWFMLLNKGYRIPATAPTDSTFDREGGGDPGAVRVYTRVDGPLSPTALATAMKAGRNLVTSGPLLIFEAGDFEVGDVVPAPTPVRLNAKVTAWASGKIGEYLTKIEIIRNGELFRHFAVQGKRTETTAEFEIDEAETAWYVARGFGSNEDQVAITNPIYFRSEGYAPPKPTPARVTITLADKATGAPLHGKCQVLRMIGRTSKVELERDIPGGKSVLEIPAWARTRVEAEGYRPETKSVFMDFPPLLEASLNMNCQQLLNWETFEKVRNLLRDVQLRFDLSKDG